MWRNVCLLLWLFSVVAVHGSEVDCTKRLDVISPGAWVSLREMDFGMLSITKLMNVAILDVGKRKSWTAEAWHTADSKTYLRSNSSCFYTGHDIGLRELVELQMRAVKDIQFGENFIVILATDGTVWSGGCNSGGRLGHHGTETRPVLSQVMGLPPVKKIAVAIWGVVVLAIDGAMYSWGYSGTLGYETDDTYNPIPKKINFADGGIIPRANDVCCEYVQCAMLAEDSRVYSWGSEGFIGRYAYDKTPGSVAGIPEDQRISKVACGFFHTLAMTTSGRLFGWGYNSHGSLMNAPEKGEPYATELYMGGKIIRDIAAGKQTSLIVADSGDSYYFGGYWGRDWYSPQPTFRRVVFPRDILATVLYQDNVSEYDEETRGAVSLGCN